MTAAPGPQVWCIDLVAAEDALLVVEGETPRLSDEERDRATRIVDAEGKRQWMAAHVALRLVLERALGASVRGASFSIAAGGKPSLPGAPLVFSFAHAAGHALIAIAADGPLGVDVEGARPARISDERRAAIETAAEALTAAPLSTDAQARFVQAWVRMEALAKVEGEGLAKVLARTGAYGPGRRGGKAVPGAQLRPRGLEVADLALGGSLYGAIAMAAGGAGAQVAWMPVQREQLIAFAADSSVSAD